MELVLFVSVALAAYLLGSTPTGFLFGKARGLDIRTLGSGNIGATNVFRHLGTPAGICVLILDALKGYVACAFLAKVAALSWSTAVDTSLREPLSIVAGIAAVLGHNYTCWLGFKGGKGIATSAGVLASLLAGPLLVILGVWVIVFAASRYVSLASVAASFVLPFATWMLEKSRLMIFVAGAMGALAIYKHRANLYRLLNGTEHRVSFRKASAKPESNA